MISMDIPFSKGCKCYNLESIKFFLLANFTFHEQDMFFKSHREDPRMQLDEFQQRCQFLVLPHDDNLKSFTFYKRKPH